MVFVYKMRSRSSDNIIYAKLFNFVVQGNLYIIYTFLFWQKNELLFTIELWIFEGE